MYVRSTGVIVQLFELGQALFAIFEGKKGNHIGNSMKIKSGAPAIKVYPCAPRTPII